MAPITNPAVIFRKIPETYPIPGETVVYDRSITIDLDHVSLNGGTLVKILSLSVDPYMRGRMRDPKVESYISAFTLNKPITGAGVAVVLRSDDHRYTPGSHVLGSFPFQEYAISPPSSSLLVLSEGSLPWQQYLGAAGMPAKTAWIGYNAFAKPKKGETIYVSTAAGAVGSIVCQLAKADGLRVIGSTGSDEKVRYLLEELGLDHAFNYKTEPVKDALRKYGPFDICWDHVGGETLEAAIENMNTFGRIIAVGASAAYNAKGEYPIKNISRIVTKTLSFNGFIVGYLESRVGNFDFYKAVPNMVKEGRLHMREYVVEGLDKAGDLILEVLMGLNEGKAILKLAEQ